MPERIYITAEDGKLEPLDEKPFPTEDELQALIAEHPELLDGEQIQPGNARRWILITREKGIAQSTGEGARWAVDHLIIDQDAVPTLAEVKRGSNSEIRRTIVGQMLEYAAHASESWTADELRNAFERQTSSQGLDPGDELAALLQVDGEPDVDAFWQAVSTNLAAKRLRLLFVADDIPDPLERVVEFLNAQMPGIEVLAVEIKQFHGKSARTLVPRVMGRTANTRAYGQGRSREKITRDSFLEGFATAEARSVAENLLDVVKESGGDVRWRTTGVSVRIKCPVWSKRISLAWLYPQPGRGWMRTRDFSFGASVLEEQLPAELRAVLEGWVEQFSRDSFTDDVSSQGVQAWAVSHETAYRHKELLADRLRTVVSELTSL